MREQQLDLRPFRSRVRLVRAWRGLAIGLLAGGVFGLVWAVLDFTGVWFAEWLWLALVFAGSGVLCAVAGALLPVKDDAVARSVDRRAGLRDRLGTMIERKGADESFDAAQRHDTEAHVAALKARAVYPVRMGRWQYVALATVALASLVFLLGNTWYVFDADARKAKEELEKIAAQIERVAKPILDNKDATEEEKSFANELDAFARRMEKGKMTKEEAMQRANELAKQAEKLTRERTDRAFEKMQTAREQMTLSNLSDKGIDKKALDKLNMGERQQQLLQQLQRELGIDPKAGGDKFGKEQMEQLGLQQYDPSLLNLTDEERDKLRELIQERLNDIDKKLADAKNLTPDEMRSILESKKQLEEMQEQLEVSDEMRKALEEFMNSPEFKDIMKAVDKMRDAAKQVNEGQPLSEQQIQDLEQMLDDLEQKLEDSKYKEMVMEQMRAALEMLKAGKATCEAGGT